MERKILLTASLLISAVLSMVLLVSFSAWAVPSLINYQGKLTNIDDCAQDGDHQMSFSLYPTETSGTAIWSEQQTVAVTGGIYNVQLGAVNPLQASLFDYDDLYLQVEVNGDPLSPRMRITSTAYAMKADHAATAASATNATKANTATKADSATEAGYAATAGDADTVDGKHASDLISTVPTGGIIMYSGAWNFDGTGKGTGVLDGWALCNGNNGTPNLTDRFVMAASASGELGAIGGANSYTLTTSQMPSHSHTFTTNSAGSHTHAVYWAGGADNRQTAIQQVQTYLTGNWWIPTLPAGEHTHSGTTAGAGSGTAIDNRPAFLKLAYIMKL